MLQLGHGTAPKAMAQSCPRDLESDFGHGWVSREMGRAKEGSNVWEQKRWIALNPAYVHLKIQPVLFNFKALSLFLTLKITFSFSTMLIAMQQLPPRKKERNSFDSVSP